MSGGQAYGFASQSRRVQNTVPPKVWAEVVEVYQRALRSIWWLGMGLSIICFCLVWVEKSIPLRKELNTQYGIDEKNQTEEKSSNVIEAEEGKELTETENKA